MPFSFTQIEQEKSNVIHAAMATLALIYFIFFYSVSILLRMFFYKWMLIEMPESGTGLINVHYRVDLLSLPEIIFILGLAIFIAFFHWSISTRNLVPRVLKLLRTRPLDLSNEKHKQFQNILEELSVATGGHRFEGQVISTMAVNAFALADFDGNQVIGVTEGLLLKLKRPQLEAIIGHEAAHLIRGDTLDATMMISLFNLPTEVLKDFRENIDDAMAISFSRISLVGAFLFVALFILGMINKTIGQLLNMFISRQREFRADAIAVRLTRDPLSLAQALFIASHHWRGAGIVGENLSPIFFVRPKYNQFKESDSFWADLLATHPPMQQRLNILLAMAHTSEELLVEELAREDQEIWQKYNVPQLPENQWWVRQDDGKWVGPLEQKDIASLDWIGPQTLVQRIGELPIMTASCFGELKTIVDPRGLSPRLKEGARLFCPECYVYLKKDFYAGSSVYHCLQCGGYLNEEKVMTNILTSPVQSLFNADIEYRSQIITQGRKILDGEGIKELYGDYGLACPRCQKYNDKMVRKFYSNAYQVEIDKCSSCGLIWFEKGELETLHYLAQGHLSSK